MRVSLILFFALVSWSAGPVLAQDAAPTFPADFPPRSIRFTPFTSFTTSDDAEKAFKDRAALVIRWNACGREWGYVSQRANFTNKNFDSEGDIIQFLTPKIAWLNDPVLGQQACEAPAPFTISESDIDLWNTRPTNCQDLLSAAHNKGADNKGTVSILVKVTPDCMRRQVNEGIRAMEKHAQMGTDKLFCLLSTKGVRKGDFDPVVRMATRLLYMGRIGSNPVLTRPTIDYMYKNLLVAKGGLSDADYSLIAGCDDPAGDDTSSPEEWADQEKWSNELLSALGDVLKWPFDVGLKFIGGFLAAGAALDSAPLLLIAGESPSYPPYFDLRIPETENHRLMIESSKYLINNAMIRELDAAGYDKSALDAKRDEQKQVREWLLTELQRIAINDFDEYNSRTYTDYSLESILNLYDFSNLAPFSNDQEMCTASAIVLDLSAAKFVAGSNRGRRIAPYRRRTENDGTDLDLKNQGPKDLYNIFEGADHEVVRAVMLAGQTQLLNNSATRPMPGSPLPPGAKGASAEESGGMVNTAISDYRLPDALLRIVADRDTSSTAYPFSQSVRHGGIESYYQSRAFTMSLGGIRTPAPHSFYGTEAFNHSDRGIAMPTSIIPTIAGRMIDDVFSLLGDGTQDKRSENLCGWQGFICGINPHIPDVNPTDSSPLAFFGCSKHDLSHDDSGTIVDYIFVNSAACPEFSGTPGPHFFLAAKVAPCPDTFCKKSLSYGLMEIAEKADIPQGFDAFRGDRKAALSKSVPDKEGNGVYTTTHGDTINYQIKQDHSHISTVNGVSHPQFSSSPKFLTQGDMINSEGNGKIVIKDPSPGGGAILTIDFSDALHPHDFTDALHPELTPTHCKCEKEPLPVRCQKQPPVDTGHPVN